MFITQFNKKRKGMVNFNSYCPLSSNIPYIPCPLYVKKVKCCKIKNSSKYFIVKKLSTRLSHNQVQPRAPMKIKNCLCSVVKIAKQLRLLHACYKEHQQTSMQKSMLNQSTKQNIIKIGFLTL